jgi:SAM-dependent methyltransferase
MSLNTGQAEHLSREAGRRAFGTDAAGYHVGRIGYPDDLFEKIFERVCANPRILEIGAGTGLATRSLLDRNPCELVVVESDPVLVEYLRERFPHLTLINAGFPDVAIDGSFDLIVCAAAFHWMEPSPALARIRELLKPDGVWAMWWNAYRNPTCGDALAQAITPLLANIPLPPSEGRDGHYSLDVSLHRTALEAAGFDQIESSCYRHERTLNAAEVRALYASYSYVRALPEHRRVALLKDINALVDGRFGGRAVNVVMTSLYSAKGR